MKIVEVPIKDLKPAEYNPRKMDEKQVKDLTQSVKEFGLVDPLIVNNHKGRENVVVGGHQRLKIASILGLKSVPVVYVDLEEKRERELNLRLNRNLGEFDYDLLANFSEEELNKIGFESEELDKIFGLDTSYNKPENIDGIKDLKDIKILDLYSCIGGNRKFWGDLDITAVEINPEIAKVYQDYYPKDKMIIGDAHKYLEENFDKFDFIWASPPCPTHSRMRKQLVGGKRPVFPDMKLYEEILFLQGYFKGKWVIENVISWYEPLIKPQERGRHYYWSNFDIRIEGFPETMEIGSIDDFDPKIHQKKFGFNLDKYHFSSKYPKDKILRDMVHPKVGEFILKCAFKI